MSGKDAVSGTPVFRDLPFPTDWLAWRKQFAIARLPRVDWKPMSVGDAEKVLRHMGYATAGEGRWHHPDGSRLVLREKMIDNVARAAFSELGFQRWEYESFPCQVLDEWTRDFIWDDTDAWHAWLQGKKDVPPFSKDEGAHGD